MKFDASLTRRVVFAGLVDLGIELGAGSLGAYFGALMAALWMTLKEDAPGAMNEAIRAGFGNGFLFWFLAFSFLNRVVYQGISRASIGKHLFQIELASPRPVTWTLMVKRWVGSLASVVSGGMLHWAALFTASKRPLHDLAFEFVIVSSNAGELNPEQTNQTFDNVIPLRPLPQPAPSSESEDSKKSAA